MRHINVRPFFNLLALGQPVHQPQIRCLSDGHRLCTLIVGAPGSGKGTISKWIVRDFGLVHVSSGDLLRQHVREGTEVGKLAKQFIDKGGLVPDDVMVKLISSELKTLEKSNVSWLLDGFPRTQNQAQALQNETPVNAVIYLDVPFQTIIDRVKDRWLHPASGRIYNTEFNPPKVAFKDDQTGEDLIQREDDKPENVLKRLEVFSAETKPVLEFFRKMGILAEFKGTESKKIWPHVEAHLKTLAKRK
jgi:nucleoside-triphosphate--adenylate kinase